MTKTHPFGLLFIAVFITPLFPQAVPISSVPGLKLTPTACTNQTSFICAVPNIYGTYGLVLPNPGIASTFSTPFLHASYAATATELVLLPLANPDSGFVYQYDPATGLYSRTTQSLGPVLTDRGETIGRHKFTFGGSYQRFRFQKLDGIDLHNVPVAYQAVPNPTAGDPALAAQFITTRNSLDIKINEYTVFATYGLTNRIDVSVAVPYSQVQYNVNSVATINRIFGTEPILSPNPAGGAPIVSCCSTGGPGPYGPVFGNFFDPADPVNSTVREFSNGRNTSPGDLYFNPNKSTAAGIGDVTLRGKVNLYNDEHVSFALVTDVRLPTGDAKNFLGTGTTGVKPVGALSFRQGWLTPHVNIGYQWNGSSVLGGDPILGTKGGLPGWLVFSAGSDVPISKYVTLSADYLGEEIINAPRVGERTFQSPGPLTSTGQVGTFQTIVPLSNSTYNQSDAAVGMKINAFDHLLVTLNAVIALNDSGIRQKITPMVGLSYVF